MVVLVIGIAGPENRESLDRQAAAAKQLLLHLLQSQKAKEEGGNQAGVQLL